MQPNANTHQDSENTHQGTSLKKSARRGMEVEMIDVELRTCGGMR